MGSQDICLISPRLSADLRDPMTTGIVYMPVMLAYLAGYLRGLGHKVTVIDCLADAVETRELLGDKIWIGKKIDSYEQIIFKDFDFIGIFANQVANHQSVCDIIDFVSRQNSNISVLQNSQAVTAYSLKAAINDFKKFRVSGLICGDLECGFSDWMNDSPHGESKLYERFFSSEELDDLPLPAWDLWELNSYWQIPFAHGPRTDFRYLPIITSRGCPYPCRFCVVPSTSLTKWRGRSALSVYKEIVFLKESFLVNEFHIEDLDPTVSDSRTNELAAMLTALQVSLKIVAGTKIETIKTKQTLVNLKSAGLEYLSISPETGSKRVLKLMKKPFNLEHGFQIVKWANELGIKTQACFVLGFPGEEKVDLVKTLKLIRKLSIVGVDEIAIFIVTPVPGSDIFVEMASSPDLSALTFSPFWRQDFKSLNRTRIFFYLNFILITFARRPQKLLPSIIRFVTGKYHLKMEMAPRRFIWYRFGR